MGYQTSLTGSFKLNKKLTPELHKKIFDFSEQRHEGDEFPGIWCKWAPSQDGLAIEWNGYEKFYDYIEWISYLISNFLASEGYKLNGEVVWKGESKGDIGTIVIKNNTVTTKSSALARV